MSIITISSIFEQDFDNFCAFCGGTCVEYLIDTTGYEDGLTEYIFRPIWYRYLETPIKFSNDEKGKDAFLRNFCNQLNEVVFDFYTYCKENIDYFMYQTNPLNEGKPMSKNITTGINPINQNIDQAVDSTSLASGTGSQFINETVYNGVAWHKLVDGYFTPNRKTALLNAFQWLFVSVYSPETKYDDKIEEKRTVDLWFRDEEDNLTDEQHVFPTKSYFTMSEVIINRPEDLVPEHIKRGEVIAGVFGSYEVPIYEYLNLPLDLTDDMDIKAEDYGYAGIKEVVIEKPATAVASNIAYGVNIGGIIGEYLGADTLEKRISGNQAYTYANNNITTLNGYGFYHDTNITSFSSTSCITVNREVFNSCTNLTNVSLPNATTFDSYGYQFNYCTSLTSISLPKVTSIAHNVFSQCYALTTLDLPEVTQVTYNAISYCNALTTLTLPKCTLINQSGIVDNSNMASIYLPLCASLGNRALYSNSGLTDIYLGKTDGICALNASNGIPASSTQHLTIHVPSDLISTYQTASNWSTHYNNGYITFVAI